MATTPAGYAATPDTPPGTPYLWKRHSLPTRITHWINVVAISFLLGSGLNIFNAHPSLYWGAYGADAPAPGGGDADAGRRWLDIDAAGTQANPRGVTTIGPVSVDTTGVLGISQHDGAVNRVGFPAWATFPAVRDLATARNWHFFFAWVLILNGLIYYGYGLASGHLKSDILPRLRELRLSNIWHDIALHARLKFPKGEDSKRYHILQKLAYGGTIFVLLPLMIFTGLAMSPGIGATWSWLIDLLGGRQSARSIHFITASLVVGFIIVHVLMVVLAGPYNEIRSMITGRFRIDPETTR